MNLPNKLTCLRMVMIPVFLVFMVTPEMIGEVSSRIVALVLFALTAFTDMLDGKIARKYGLITDFGKFMDPLADKVMVFGAMLGIISLNAEYKTFTVIFIWASFIIIFRELAVTSMRLVVSSSEGIVIPANIFGKLKTISQIIGIGIIVIEPVFWDLMIFSYISAAVMVLTTVVSGVSYFKAYRPYIKTNK